MPVQGSVDRRPSIPCKIVRETEKAWLLDVGETKPIWFPKSQGEIYSRADGSKELFGEEWVMKEKGLC